MSEPTKLPEPLSQRAVRYGHRAGELALFGTATLAAAVVAITSKPSTAEAMPTKAGIHNIANQKDTYSKTFDSLAPQRAKLARASARFLTLPEDGSDGIEGEVVFVKIGGKVYGLTAAHNLQQFTGDTDGVMPGTGVKVYRDFPGLNLEIDDMSGKRPGDKVLANPDSVAIYSNLDVALVGGAEMSNNPALLARALDGSKVLHGEIPPGTLAAGYGLNSNTNRPVADSVVSGGRVYMHTQKRWMDLWLAKAPSVSQHDCFWTSSGGLYQTAKGSSGPQSWMIEKANAGFGPGDPAATAAWNDVMSQVPKSLYEKVKPNIACLSSPTPDLTKMARAL
jgi:hypothetical protein